MSLLSVSTAQPSLSLWLNPDDYHQHHDHSSSQEHFCDSSYYLFYQDNSDSLFITVKNEGTETLVLSTASTQSIAGASFKVIDFSPQQILPGEMYTFKLTYDLPDTYINGINGQLTLISNDPERTACTLFFEVGCQAVWITDVGTTMGVPGSCASPVIWIEDVGTLSNPNMLYDDSMNFYTYEVGFQSIKAMQLDHKGGVLVPNYLSVYERLEAGSRDGDFPNFKADSNLVEIGKDLDVNGNVSIGDTLDVDKDVFIGRSLSVNLNGYVKGTFEVEAMTTPSDRRLKHEIVPIKDAVHNIMMLDPKAYFKKDSQTPDRLQFGFIAQELESTLPELVHTSGDDMKSVNYVQLIPWLTAALQEQQETIERLERRIADLESK